VDLAVDCVDVVGDLLFGRRLRLRVLLWASDQTRAFNQSEAARGVNYNSSGEVAKELERLVQLEMLQKFGRPSRVGPQNYLRIKDHPGWGIAAAARKMIDGEASQPQGGDAPLQVLEVVDGGERLQGPRKGVHHKGSPA
jgi:hypothetical protein